MLPPRKSRGARRQTATAEETRSCCWVNRHRGFRAGPSSWLGPSNMISENKRTCGHRTQPLAGTWKPEKEERPSRARGECGQTRAPNTAAYPCRRQGRGLWRLRRGWLRAGGTAEATGSGWSSPTSLIHRPGSSLRAERYGCICPTS